MFAGSQPVKVKKVIGDQKYFGGLDHVNVNKQDF